MTNMVSNNSVPSSTSPRKSTKTNTQDKPEKEEEKKRHMFKIASTATIRH